MIELYQSYNLNISKKLPKEKLHHTTNPYTANKCQKLDINIQYTVNLVTFCPLYFFCTARLRLRLWESPSYPLLLLTRLKNYHCNINGIYNSVIQNIKWQLWAVCGVFATIWRISHGMVLRRCIYPSRTSQRF